MISTTELPTAPKLPFYDQLKDLLDNIDFDHHVESACRPYYKSPLGRPSIPPGVYFRLLLLSYLIGVDSERALALYARDSLSVRQFLGYALHEAIPAASTLSRTRRRIPLNTQREVLGWALRHLREQGLDGRLARRSDWATSPTARVHRPHSLRAYRKFVASLAEHANRDAVADKLE